MISGGGVVCVANSLSLGVKAKPGCLLSRFVPHAPSVTELNMDRAVIPVVLNLLNEARRVRHCGD